ncbi:MAG: hypothetical protein ABIO92_03490 [Chloroflexia bacterium]
MQFISRGRSTACRFLLVLLTLLLTACGQGSSNGGTPTPTTPGSVTPASSSAPSARPPVVLVHGWKASLWGEAFSGCPDDYKNYVPPTPVSEEVDFGSLGPELRDKHGMRVYYARLLTSPCYTPPVDANIPAVMAAIDRAKAETGEIKVVLVAHSMGGLVARAYVESSSYRGDVSDLFTLGSPHDGVDISSNWLAILLAPKAMDLYDYLGKQEVMQDFKRGAMSRYAERRQGVKYHLIGGDLPIIGRTPLGGLTYLVSGGIPGDGLVAVQSSARLAGDIDFTKPPEAHSDGLGAPDYFTQASKARQCIIDALATGKVCGVRTGSAQAPAVGQAPVSLPPLCKATEFANLLAKHDIGPHMPDALREYTKDCYQRGMTAFELTEAAVKAGLQIRLLSIDSKVATGFVADGAGRRSGVLPGGQVVEEIPGSRVLSLSEATYVFYPPSEVTAEVKGTGVGTADIKLVRGADPSRAEVITFDPVKVTQQMVARVSPGEEPVLAIDTNSDGKVEVTREPKVKREIRPAQP